jgi:hypothetical protein
MSYPDVAVTGDGLDVQMIRQSLTTLDPKAQEPLQSDTDSTPNTAQGNPFQPQARNQCAWVIREEIWLAVLDDPAPTGVALMILFTGVNVPIFLYLGTAQK